MKPICFIGARGGSKGVPRKNIKNIAGKPLIAYSIQSAIKSNLFSHVIVSTEDRKIATVAKKFGAEVPFMRPTYLATDSIGFAPVLYHVIKKLFSLGYDFEIIVSRDCTAPFIRNEDIDGAVKLLEKRNANAVFGVYKQHFNPYFNMLELTTHGFLELSKKKGIRPRGRQEAPTMYQMTGMHTFNVEKFLKYKKIMLPKILPYEIPPATGIMIDTEFEFKMVEMLMKEKINFSKH